MKTVLAVITIAGIAFAQDAPPVAKAPVLNASVSGIVRDKNTGKPLANYTVSTYVGVTWFANTIIMPATSRDVKSTTDESGHYKLADLPAAPYRITARDSRGGFGSDVTKHVVMSGHDLEDLNFDIIADGVIKGRIVDENQDPVPGVTVTLVSREYFLGSPGYFFKSFGRPTNDKGEFTLDKVPAGQPLYLTAELRRRDLPAHSETPFNPKLRRRVPMRTWYPNSPSREGAAPIMVRPGEVRADLKIEMKKSPNFCAEGTLLTGSGGPGALNYSVEPQQPSSGVNPHGGIFTSTGSGRTGSDGAFRFCDLYPGSYRIQASQTNGDLLYGVATIVIADQDIKGLKIAALPTQPLAGEVVLDGPVPATPLATKVSVTLQPLLRTQMPGERAGAGRVEIPSSFSMPGVTSDDYLIRTMVNGQGLYIKDVLWAGNSVQYQPFRPGASPDGTGLRVVIGQDGGTISAAVATKDGNPAPDIRVIAFPAEIASEGTLSSSMVASQTDQAGAYKSQPLAPGKYYVGAVDGSIDYTVDVIARVWRSRSRFTEVDLAPSGSALVMLEPVALAP